MIRVFRTGTHALRTPLSYPALAPLFTPAITLVDRPEDADMYLFAHSMDIATDPWPIIADWRRRRRPVVILSEEPFWDTIWGRAPLARTRVLETVAGPLPVSQINHQTDDLFRFDRLPYYLLTHPRFLASYRTRFARNAALSETSWRQRFAAARSGLTFMFERRPERYHDVTWPEGDLIGLCAWRTDLAQAFTESEAERLGQSWQGGATRFDLDDWYGDKMQLLDGRARILGAVENTHQPHYLTEKIFDAFACGSLPLYYATRAHRLHEFDLPEAAWLNLAGYTAQEAADLVRGVTFDSLFFDAFRAAQEQLRRIFTDDALVAQEHARLARALPAALRAVLDSDWR